MSDKSKAQLEILARTVGKFANTCCHHSDWFEEEVIARCLAALQDAVEAEREACAKTCIETGAYQDEIEMAIWCAENIRSRSNAT